MTNDPNPTRRATDVMRIVGFDPSMRNWGIASGFFTPSTGEIEIVTLDVINAIVNKGKQTRQNSEDLDVAMQLSQFAMAAAMNAQAIFVEVPVGSQSARSMMSCGLCIGVLGALRASGKPFFEVNPSEVKLATGLSRTASKAQMIEWAMKKYPNAPWPMKTEKGVQSVVLGKAEHMADACASIEAGIISKPFQQALAFIKPLT